MAQRTPSDHIDADRLRLGKTQVLDATRAELRHMFRCDACCTAFYEFSEQVKRAERRPRRAQEAKMKNKSVAESEQCAGEQ
jgi:hypothetical protein